MISRREFEWIAPGAGLTRQPRRDALAQQPRWSCRAGISIVRAAWTPFFELVPLQACAALGGSRRARRARNLTASRPGWAAALPPERRRLDRGCALRAGSRRSRHVIVTQGGALQPFRAVPRSRPRRSRFSGRSRAGGFRRARSPRRVTGVSSSEPSEADRLLKDGAELTASDPRSPAPTQQPVPLAGRGKALGLTLEYFPVRGEPELERHCACDQDRTEAVVVSRALTLRARERIARFGRSSHTGRLGLGSVRRSGCLMSYGPNLRVVFRRLATSSTGSSRAPGRPSCRSSCRPPWSSSST